MAVAAAAAAGAAAPEEARRAVRPASRCARGEVRRGAARAGGPSGVQIRELRDGAGRAEGRGEFGGPEASLSRE